MWPDKGVILRGQRPCISQRVRRAAPEVKGEHVPCGDPKRVSGGLDTLGIREAGAGAGPFDDGDFDEIGVLAVRARELFVIGC